MKKLVVSLISGWILAFVAASVVAAPGFSEVNNELFDKAHLKNIEQPGTLLYEYHKQSFVEGTRDDTIKMMVSNIRNTGRSDTSFEFFTGQHKRPYEAMNNQRGNGIFVLFLEFDVHEMNRLTGGEWRYFQRKLRWAFAEGATKKEVDIDYNGKTVRGTQYIVQPYVNDPKNARYKLYANKYYIFTLSEEVPGEVYQVRTVVPDGKTWKEGDPALVDESVTFVGFDAN
ncbi:hypothetical protein OMP95_11110 [Methylophaga sp. OBS4]|nr:hypothetical protein [Methylophaga sp. OBS4]MCX4188396.1 hypothetical protein [Methylophaga sp. OBS4]